jgi:hypothetical protein
MVSLCVYEREVLLTMKIGGYPEAMPKGEESPSPHAHSFVLGPAVINTHTEGC